MRKFYLSSGLFSLFLGWNMPNHYPLWTTFHGELVAAFGVALVLAGLLCSQNKVAAANIPERARRQFFTTPELTWLAVAVLPVLQYSAGRFNYYGDALLGFLYFAGIGISVYAGRLWAVQAGSTRVLRDLLLTVLLAAVAAGGVAYSQWLRLPPPGWWAMELIASRPYGNLAQPNLFALLMVLGIISGTALFEMRLLQRRVSYWLVLLFLGGAMLLSGSRGALVSVLAVSGVWFATCRRVPTRLQWHEPVLAIAVGCVTYSSIGYVESLLLLGSSPPRSVMEVGPREAIWLHFWAAVQSHPWLGYGFGQGVAALREVAAQVQPSRNSIYAHNIVLDLMVWFGIPVAVAMSAALVVWMGRWLHNSKNTELMVQRHWVFAFWLALLVQSMLEYPFAHAFFTLPAALLAGAVSRSSGPEHSCVPPLNCVAGRSAIALAGSLVVLLSLTAWDYFQFEAEFRANRFNKANFTIPAEHEARTGPVMLDQLAALNESSRYKVRSGMPNGEIEQLGQLARRFHLLPTRFEYAKALTLNGRMEDAAAELVRVQSVYHPLQWAQIERDWREWIAANEK